MTADYVLEGVRHEYRAGAPALAAIDLTILSGQHVAIVGANGSGKSTLLKMLDGLVFPTSGAISAFGAPLTADALEDPAYRRDFRSRVGFVFQEADVQLFCSDAYDELAFGPLQLGLAREEVERRVREAAQQLRIEQVLDRPPYTLSGGEKKRVAIASVLTMQPHVLLLDEPTNALDPRSQVWLLDVLEVWKQEGRTVVMATHDLSAAAERSWVAMKTVRPSCFHTSSTSSSQTWLRGSRALVGSSSRRTCGCMVSTEAMATRFFSPPLSVYGGRSSTCSIRSCCAASRTRRSTSSRARPSCSGPKASSS